MQNAELFAFFVGLDVPVFKHVLALVAKPTTQEGETGVYISASPASS